MTDKLVIEDNIHTSAAALIIAAAEKSGLLREVAEALCCFNQYKRQGFLCGPCMLRDDLADEFDTHVCFAAGLLENFYGEGFTPFFSDAEVAPYLNSPTKDAA
jgi:hypothetical protein